MIDIQWLSQFILFRKLNDSRNNSIDAGEWKGRALEAEERLQELEQEMDRYKDDILLMSARKKDLAKMTDLNEENKKLNHQVAFYK